MNPGSVGPNLAVPMTPLVSDHYVRDGIQMPASNLPAAMMPQVLPVCPQLQHCFRASESLSIFNAL